MSKITKKDRPILPKSVGDFGVTCPEGKTWKIISKLEQHALHSCGYGSREKAERVVEKINKDGAMWTNKRLSNGGFKVVEDI